MASILKVRDENGQIIEIPALVGKKGDDGVGITKIEKTSTEGLVDTYTITMSDGRTSTFTVTNGIANGEENNIDLSNYVTKDEMPDIDVDKIVERRPDFDVNLFEWTNYNDKSQWIDNSRIDTNGTIVNDNTYCLTPFISMLSPNSYLYFDCPFPVRLACYDVDYNYIGEAVVEPYPRFKTTSETAAIRFVVMKCDMFDNDITFDFDTVYNRFVTEAVYCPMTNYAIGNHVIIPNVPTKVSELENDAGYITEINNITPEQTTFFNVVPSENLLDISTIKDGMLHTNGRIYTAEDDVAYSMYKYFEQYIPVSEGDILAVQCITPHGLQSSFDGSATFSRVVAYDDDKQVLSSLGGISTSGNTLYFYTVPASVSFVRICLDYTFSRTNLMITRNATGVLPYQPYEGTYIINEIYLPEREVVSVDEKVNLPKDENGNIQYGINGQVLQTNGDGSTRWAENNAVVNSVTPEQTTFFELAPSTNLLDISTMKIGLLNNNGKIYTTEDNASYGAYRYFEQYIPVDEGDEISVQYTRDGLRQTTTGGAYSIARVAAYNSEKQILSSLGAITNSTNKVYVYKVPATVKYIRLCLSSTIDQCTDIAVVKNTSDVIPYDEYGVSRAYLKEEHLKKEKKDIIAFLPDEISCAVGRTIEIYNKQVCPLAEKYHFRWLCNVGKALERKFSITGTEALIGDYSLTLEIFDDDENCLYSKLCNLKIVSNTLTDNITICPIGDSLTNTKQWLNEVPILSENKISYVGTRGGGKHEGRSGFTSTGYTTAHGYDFEQNNVEDVHPFWDGSKFSWSYYKTNSGINPTAVQIFLGTNDLFNVGTGEVLSANIKTMVDSIRLTDANMPIFIVLTILVGSQNGLGKQENSDGFAMYKGKYKYSLDCKFIKAMEVLHDTLKDYSNLYFVPLTECHDNEYNFGAVETAVNPRATQKEYMPNEGIHPQQQGYEQMADVMYSVYCRAFAE